MRWVYLALAIATEVVGTLALRQLADGFRVVPAAIVTVSYVASFVLMVPGLKSINVSVSYAIWSAVGTAAVALLGAAIFGDRLNWIAGGHRADRRRHLPGQHIRQRNSLRGDSAGCALC